MEMQEDALKPNLQFSIDARSRYQLVQLRLTNRGRSSAHNVRILWDKGPVDAQGRVPTFGVDGTISVLHADEYASVLLDVAHEFFQRNPSPTFTGKLEFETAIGTTKESFVLSGDHVWRGLLHDEEEPKTLFELQKLPASLEKIAEEIRKLSEFNKP